MPLLAGIGVGRPRRASLDTHGRRGRRPSRSSGPRIVAATEFPNSLQACRPWRQAIPPRPRNLWTSIDLAVVSGPYWRGCSTVVVRELPKLDTRVRFPSPAPISGWGNFRYDVPRHRVFHEDDRDGFSEQLQRLTRTPDPDRRPARRRERFSGRGRRRREALRLAQGRLADSIRP